jgi:hypothetical protein
VPPRGRQAFKPAPSLNRRTGTAKPLSKIVAYCEGATEKLYLDQFASYVGRRLIDIEVVPEIGTP